MNESQPVQAIEPQAADPYEAPAIEAVMAPADLEREVMLASIATKPPVCPV